MAPAAAVAFSIIVGAQFAGGALPLAVVLALVACLLVAVSIGQLAKHLPSAGGFYTYTARGLHPAFGFLVAWGYAFAEPFVAPLLYLIFGNVVGGVLSSEFGWSFETWWVISAVVAAVVVFVLGYLGVTISAGTGTVLGIFEIGVFLALALWLIVKAGNANTLAVFGTGQATVEGFTGFSGIAAASIYTILAFIGFEAAAPLAEEAKDPRRTIRQAVIYSALGIGVFYVITTYAATVFFGPDKMAGFAKFGNGNPWDGLARQVWGVGWVVVFLAIANSAIANANVAANATTRTWYAMGRIRLLPSGFARVHPTRRSPYVAVTAQFVFALVVSLWLGKQYGPLTAFALIATIDTAIIITIYILVNLACMLFYARQRRSEFNLARGLDRGRLRRQGPRARGRRLAGDRLPLREPQTGPFHVEGAEPGDTLAVHFVSIEPSRDWAASTTVPLFGALSATHTTAMLHEPLPEVVWIYQVDRRRRTVTYTTAGGDYTVDLPLDPMHGTVGVAPGGFEARSSLVPDAHGGNMDTPEMRAGTSCYLGVNVEGASFSLGDGHCRQGEGETCGVAVEAAMDTVLVLDLVKGVATPWPRLETDSHIMTAGSARPLEDAFRIAQADLVQWLASDFGLDALDGYQLVTQASETPVANVCDPNYTVVAKLRKQYLPERTVYGGTHARMRGLGRAYLAERG
jgi:amino acid transporter/acetamidase/formamidase